MKKRCSRELEGSGDDAGVAMASLQRLSSKEGTPEKSSEVTGLLLVSTPRSDEALVSSPYGSTKGLDAAILSMALPMLATLAADPIAGLVDSAFMGHISATQLAAVSVALTIFNTITKILNSPLLAVTTSYVALAAGAARAAHSSAGGGGRSDGGSTDRPVSCGAGTDIADGPAGAASSTGGSPTAGAGATAALLAAAGSSGGAGGSLPTSASGGPTTPAAQGTADVSAGDGGGGACGLVQRDAAAGPSASSAAAADRAPASLAAVEAAEADREGRTPASAQQSTAGGSSSSAGAGSDGGGGGMAVAGMGTEDRLQEVTELGETAAEATQPLLAGAGGGGGSSSSGSGGGLPSAAAADSAHPITGGGGKQWSAFWLDACKGAGREGKIGASSATASAAAAAPGSEAAVAAAATALAAAAADAAAEARAAGACLLLALLLGLAQSALLLGLGRWLLGVWGVHAGSPVWAPALGFLTIRALAAPVTSMLLVAQGVFRGLQDTHTPLKATLAVNFLNLAFTPVLLFVCRLGAPGAAAGTTAAQAVTLLGLLLALRRRLPQLRLVPRAALALPSTGTRAADDTAGGGAAPSKARVVLWSILREVLPLFKPTGYMVLRSVAFMGTYAVANALASHAGAEASASYQICFQIWMSVSLLADALSVAAQSLMARDLSSGCPQGAAQVAARVLELGGVLGLVLAAALGAGHRLLPRAFSSDPEVLGLAAVIMPIVAACEPVTVVAMVLDGVLYGTGGFRYAVLLAGGAATPSILVMLLGSRAAFKHGKMLTSAAVAGGASASAAGGVPSIAAGMGVGRAVLTIVWLGLAVLMVMRCVVIAAPYAVRRGPFSKLRRSRWRQGGGGPVVVGSTAGAGPSSSGGGAQV
ncbi:hypothetical protein HYH03_005809 [Edaphochlamys debaryana]|uniref:Protein DETOXIFICATION n=1 Tax=Edaphochlamys debaryana TaxID=47281 RepID=A0A836C0Z3_9CHLO|nr:hypothetical protein HYH03_005809 [Edaphochlamys debaryana]|eukprot:KAG2496210.1 hypothetical protein HYH03_005809 [Edaphochlamys debaryana]